MQMSLKLWQPLDPCSLKHLVESCDSKVCSPDHPLLVSLRVQVVERVHEVRSLRDLLDRCKVWKPVLAKLPHADVLSEALKA